MSCTLLRLALHGLSDSVMAGSEKFCNSQTSTHTCGHALSDGRVLLILVDIDVSWVVILHFATTVIDEASVAHGVLMLGERRRVLEPPAKLGAVVELQHGRIQPLGVRLDEKRGGRQTTQKHPCVVGVLVLSVVVA